MDEAGVGAAGKGPALEAVRIGHAQLLDHPELIYSKPAGSFVVADHGGAFMAYYSLGKGKYTAGNSAASADEAHRNALADWSGARYNHDPADFKPIDRSIFPMEQADLELPEPDAAAEGNRRDIKVGDVVCFEKFSCNDKSGVLRPSQSSGRAKLGPVRGLVVEIEDGFLLVEPFDYKLRVHLEASAQTSLATVEFSDAVLDNPVKAASKARLPQGAAEIFEAVVRALQEAEELGGPDGRDYRKLMEAVRDEASTRLANFKSHSPQFFSGGPRP